MFNFKSFKKKKNKVIVEAIDTHKKIKDRADSAIEYAIAALDGETGWFVCSCGPDVFDKECKKEKKGTQ